MASRAEEEFAVQVGQALANARLEAGRTQEEVAELLDLDKQTISRIETGKSWPSPARLVALSSLYGVEVNSLFISRSSKSRQVAGDIVEMLASLSPTDRVWVRRWLKELCRRLARTPAREARRSKPRGG
ncbi:MULTISPECIES: helix-turn-helix transcriptional regulator [Paraburkholderia]|uniref:helix-turn-helix transcriptional regulator n=1 Tax=Paraburkholderia TaxID=1822464 RepID=UPI000360CE03|nr:MULTISPECIES: helix-turn-helix transcriptional regulator [Paraburkholderia]MDH6148245.1 transcriptional regulator with XRE-family HTH domain [Paraburkholderia sp. WSM4179]